MLWGCSIRRWAQGKNDAAHVSLTPPPPPRPIGRPLPRRKSPPLHREKNCATILKSDGENCAPGGGIKFFQTVLFPF